MNRRVSILAFLALAGSAHAILPGTLTSAWPGVGKLGGINNYYLTGVAVGDHWVITAGHAVAGFPPNGMNFKLDTGEVFTSDAIYAHPTDDIALVHFVSPTLPAFPNWYDLMWSSAVGQTGTLVGYGYSGTWNGSAWVNDFTYGTKREGRNVVSLSQYVDFVDFRGTFLIYDFDSATNDAFGDGVAVANEATLGGGDSGGATFLQDGGVWKVAGVHSWTGSIQGGAEPPQYGSVWGDMQVNAYRTWIESIIPAEVVPTTMTPGPGSVVSGVIANLARPDGNYVAFRPGAVLVASQPPLQVVFQGTAPVSTTTEMRFCVQSSATATNITQGTELFNFSTNAYVSVDTRTLGTTWGLAEIAVPNPAQYIGPGNIVKARISCKANGGVLVFPWNARYDRVVWNIKR